MIVDNHKSDFLPVAINHSFPKNTLLPKIIESIKSTSQHFLLVLQNENRANFNEDEFTALFVNQNQIQINKLGISIRVGEQYRDIYHKTHGIPDIYYSFLELGRNCEPVFIMEAKRLPTPGHNRIKEYVIGQTPTGNPNGGIERFKLERHGKGLLNCGMLGYIENDSFETWLQRINDWIFELSAPWSQEEKLELVSIVEKLAYLNSVAIREGDELKLHHFWIDIRR